MGEEFFSVKELAGIFKVHPNTIYRAIEKGFIIAIRVSENKRSPYRISKRIIDSIHQSSLKEFETRRTR